MSQRARRAKLQRFFLASSAIPVPVPERKPSSHEHCVCVRGVSVFSGRGNIKRKWCNGIVSGAFEPEEKVEGLK
ncbi:hypothetical protein Q7C36_012774 [Tachysurus vachellii]|uniref:Uncharacterized protein n=1 Tax=Tachysurus vachellii TaxID=175792 RepID=A0AA88MLU2_TACVA|nr:hypothetical protein Q7C36_012774 [Tachysurus vachellii]